ncbi:MAG: hypothetical protein HOQ28_02585, partial [Thermoleophilia bacterium]|nr:hypothetical protein [Thermoleophilia bacterium]
MLDRRGRRDGYRSPPAQVEPDAPGQPTGHGCALSARRAAGRDWTHSTCSCSHGCFAWPFSALPAAAASSRLGCVKELLLAWYSQNGRDLPWRRTRDPYAILVSEVMLQQTQVERVIPRWHAWLERWPTVDALAAASAAEVIVEWQGLGYNRRAINLHRTAQQVAERGWPNDLTELAGVGAYTAAAVGNFAFGRDVLPIDTNVSRVQELYGVP